MSDVCRCFDLELKFYVIFDKSAIKPLSLSLNDLNF